MIGEHLQRYDTQQGCQEIQGLGHLDNPVGNGANLLVALGDHGNDAAATGLDLLHIGDYLLVLLVVGGDKQHGHIGIDEGDGAVLHLGSGIALGMDIADFLELEGALEGHGEVPASAQVHEVVGVGEGAGDFGDTVVLL